MSRPKTVLITGCSPGSIGEALSHEFLQRGCTVCSTGLPSETLPELEQAGAHVFPLDVRSEESVKELEQHVSKVLDGELNILINCAGMYYVMPILDISLPELRRTFDINLFGIVRIVQSFTPLLIRTHGSIVNVSSLAAYAPYVFGAAYNASKAALLALSNTLRIELSPWDISVQTILAGPVVSGLMTRTERHLPEGSLYKPIEGFFEQRTQHAKHGVKAMGREDFSKEIVEQLLAGSGSLRKTYWIGPFKWQTWLLEVFGLLSVWGLFFRRKFGLIKLK
ncbi:hypothetical protein M409DRAFT_48395 [Zasmidium cellare ATCC 36951]|uniref:NADPH-dependent 1-acyldihydroxyacetone phosphate reductase n=1 Tax=Zasmidium cellare ATCC 36951 TaxID=1080233 RepID=A0A6A6D5C0_ZASCE|nr:uncharacterized protein M409DRAFT_48395 [Zasmidium cellare ATCC 36951]KAF2173412.1 hypothetical protein M409DRAFT_48395 [Zasmidium cellare ATCC 36951]